MNNGTIMLQIFLIYLVEPCLDWLSIKFDTTAPIMVVSNIPVITDDEILEWKYKQNGMQNLGIMERLSRNQSNWKCDHTNQSR